MKEVVTLLVAAGAKLRPTEELDRSQIHKLRVEPRMHAALRGAMSS